MENEAGLAPSSNPAEASIVSASDVTVDSAAMSTATWKGGGDPEVEGNDQDWEDLLGNGQLLKKVSYLFSGVITNYMHYRSCEVVKVFQHVLPLNLGSKFGVVVFWSRVKWWTDKVDIGSLWEMVM